MRLNGKIDEENSALTALGQKLELKIPGYSLYENTQGLTMMHYPQCYKDQALADLSSHTGGFFALSPPTS